MYFSHTTDKYSVWIGGNDIDTEGQYAWVTGEPVSWTNWGLEQPRDGVNSMDCMSFHRWGNGYNEWRIRQCVVSDNFVCEGIQLFIFKR